MNRAERRALKKKIAPIAREVAKLELMAQDPEKKAEAEAKIEEIMEHLAIMEMMAVEDYIMSKGLLSNTPDNNE